uniref:Uncharacterized protein n=1 Tax=Sphaerodactylus townsendi TaxID=933632 RepID=A0ACB8EAN2_9SAUR
MLREKLWGMRRTGDTSNQFGARSTGEVVPPSELGSGGHEVGCCAEEREDSEGQGALKAGFRTGLKGWITFHFETCGPTATKGDIHKHFAGYSEVA